VQTINRIIDVFPSHQQPQIRAQLSLVLEGVICQSLIPKASGKGRALALEIMLPNPAIRNLIREDKIHQIYGVMQAGQTKYGMQTFNQSLSDLVLRKDITQEQAFDLLFQRGRTARTHQPRRGRRRRRWPAAAPAQAANPALGGRNPNIKYT
jgi:twitching motility protein PilT